ncbi:rhodanese-like domain-containing protein [Paenibacillus tarimensis]
MKKLSIILAVLLCLLLIGCSLEAPATNPAPKQVSAKEAKEMIDEGKVQVIDVRTPEEFEAGHIQGAKLIPLQQLEDRLDELDKEQSYLLVCRTGNRSAQAQEVLANHGFNHTYNMLQGMAQWPYETIKSEMD